jgi:hypothetical protein
LNTGGLRVHHASVSSLVADPYISNMPKPVSVA